MGKFKIGDIVVLNTINPKAGGDSKALQIHYEQKIPLKISECFGSSYNKYRVYTYTAIFALLKINVQGAFIIHDYYFDACDLDFYEEPNEELDMSNYKEYKHKPITFEEFTECQNKYVMILGEEHLTEKMHQFKHLWLNCSRKVIDIDYDKETLKFASGAKVHYSKFTLLSNQNFEEDDLVITPKNASKIPYAYNKLLEVPTSLSNSKLLQECKTYPHLYILVSKFNQVLNEEYYKKKYSDLFNCDTAKLLNVSYVDAVNKTSLIIKTSYADQTKFRLIKEGITIYSSNDLGAVMAQIK